MKRIMVILAMVLSSVNIFASELILKGNVDVPFSVYVNGEKYYSYNNKVTITNLPSGRYNLEIFTEGYSRELLYDYTVDVPYRSTVYATFNGNHKMYVSTERDRNNVVVVDLTPYPRRHVTHVVHHPAPAPRPVVHHYAPAPKHHVYERHDHKPAPAPHKAAPAPKAEHKVAPKNDGHKPANTGTVRTAPSTRSTASTRSTVHTR